MLQVHIHTTLRVVTSVWMNLHRTSAQTRHFYLSEHCPVAEVVDGDGMVWGHDSLSKDLLALDSSSLDPSRDIVGGDLAHIVACLDDMGCGMVVVGHILQFLPLHIDWFHQLYPNQGEVRDFVILGSCQIMHMAIVLLLRLKEIYNKVEIQIRIRNQQMRKILEISIVQNSLITS